MSRWGGWNERPTLRVIDNGAGISSIDRPALCLTVFYRGERAATHEPDGSGLGLSIVQAIAERHQAEVSLHTPEGRAGLEGPRGFQSSDRTLNERSNDDCLCRPAAGGLMELSMATDSKQSWLCYASSIHTATCSSSIHVDNATRLRRPS